MERLIAIERCSEEDPAREIATERDAKREEAPKNYESTEVCHETNVDECQDVLRTLRSTPECSSSPLRV